MAVKFLPVSAAVAQPDERPDEAVAEVIELRAKLAPAPSEQDDRPRMPVFDRAVRVLARRALSQHELGAQLRKEGYPDDEVTETLSECVTRRYLDDVELAQHLTQRLRGHKKLGKNAIRAHLLTRRIEPTVIESMIRDIDEDEEYEALLSLARSKARSLRNVERVAAERRLSGYLARRGYAGTQLRQVTKLALDEVAFGVSAAP